MANCWCSALLSNADQKLFAIFYRRNYCITLEPKMKAKMFHLVDMLENYGNELREPYSKHLGDGIFELRCKLGTDITRVLYFFIVGKKEVLTNGFIKKSQKTPKAEKELAKKYKADYERNKKSQPEYSEKTCTGIRDAIKAGICSDANKK